MITSEKSDKKSRYTTIELVRVEALKRHVCCLGVSIMKFWYFCKFDPVTDDWFTSSAIDLKLLVTVGCGHPWTFGGQS